MLDVRRLRLLHELKIRGTLAEVADAMQYSPSSVSQQLTLLEKEAGVELLRKAGRRVQLTPQAEILVAHTSALLETLERAETELAASLSTVTGTVRLAVFQSAALALLPGFLTIMRQEYPEVRVEMTQREPETALYETWARDFDIVVAEQYPGHAAPHHPGLDRATLTSDAIRLATPPVGLGGEHVASIADTASMPWVMEPRGAASRHWAEQACRSAGFEPDVRYETADLQAQIRLIESGNAVALMPDLVWTGMERPVQLLDLPGSPARNIFTSTRTAGRIHPAILACREVLERVAAAQS
ncbi:LysR substrate-binding domain-containing protein [Paenarthrobacter ureafaciens]|uniref:LysR substrate-binding domain-containing protein n=1 Tax=Paenarthrobacter ureafaciens TaxID=37931 RepID=UPI001FB312AE|nr:LysR substrate-binding domain-containing protein [Paenarthrobacter ureafaciens]UOD81875.1 LysR family transcriptional regulator [Paenarthrobacter ureafaciens]WNZ05366.1 LysR substrate-binding domain-containing protein [Paenarthrobacter ureafaciens]